MSDRTGLAEIPRFVVRAVAFMCVALVAYAAVVFTVATLFPAPGTLADLTNILPSGRPGQSYMTYQEFETTGQVDVVVVGSSHAYRSFDPRIFDRYGLTTFNLGSRAQTPLNGYYVLRDRLDQLRPRIAVIEVYPVVMANEGAESALFLLESAPSTAGLLQMSLATLDISVYNNLFLRAVRGGPPLDLGPEDVLSAVDRYVGRGYVEKDDSFNDPTVSQPETVEMHSRQLRYLRRMIDMLREADAEVVLVVTPLPDETVADILNYDELTEELADVAESRGATYLDFNVGYDLPLSRPEHYYDHHHLRQAGVEIFMPAFMEALVEAGLVEAPGG